MTTSLVSASWAGVEDIPDGTTTPPGGWEPLFADASDILYELSGRQWRGAGQSRVQIVPAARVAVAPGWEPLVAIVDGSVLGPHQGGLAVVKLPSWPVLSVDEVTVNGDNVPASSYVCDRTGLLERTDRQTWPCDGSLQVIFTHGIEPPEGGKRAVVALAVELSKASLGDGSCRLRNFQTITREGVTMAAVNLRQALDGGLTGLYEVDLWLRSVNPHRLKRRAGAWSPDMGRSIRPSDSAP